MGVIVAHATDGDRVGYGIMENFVLGPHTPSGFTEFLDPAK